MADSNNPGGLTFWDGLIEEISHPIDTITTVGGEIVQGQVNPSNALTGRPTQDQLDQIKNQARLDVLNAGGTQAQAQAAADEIENFDTAQGGGTANTAIANAALFTGKAALVAIAILIGFLFLENKVRKEV